MKKILITEKQLERLTKILNEQSTPKPTGPLEMDCVSITGKDRWQPWGLTYQSDQKHNGGLNNATNGLVGQEPEMLKQINQIPSNMNLSIDKDSIIHVVYRRRHLYFCNPFVKRHNESYGTGTHESWKTYLNSL